MPPTANSITNSRNVRCREGLSISPPHVGPVAPPHVPALAACRPNVPSRPYSTRSLICRGSCRVAASPQTARVTPPTSWTPPKFLLRPRPRTAPRRRLPLRTRSRPPTSPSSRAPPSTPSRPCLPTRPRATLTSAPASSLSFVPSPWPSARKPRRSSCHFSPMASRVSPTS